MLLLSREDVRRAMPMADAMEAVGAAFAQLAAGLAAVPVRPHVDIAPADGVALVMPAYLSESGALAVKLVSVFPHNAERHHLPTISAVVLLVDSTTGVPLALLEGGWLTALRTGAASGVATRLMSRPDAAVLALLGSGAQALPQAMAVCEARAIQRITLYSPTREHSQRLAEELRAYGDRVPSDVRVSASPSEALADADVICCATRSTTPVFADADLHPGTHINGIGSYRPDMAEVPLQTVARARVVVDQWAAAWEEAGDLIQALHAGVIEKGHVVAELGELVLGRAAGRTSHDEITLFKSVGNAVQDAAVAQLAYIRAREQGLGTEFAL